MNNEMQVQENVSVKNKTVYLYSGLFLVVGLLLGLFLPGLFLKGKLTAGEISITPNDLMEISELGKIAQGAFDDGNAEKYATIYAEDGTLAVGFEDKIFKGVDEVMMVAQREIEHHNLPPGTESSIEIISVQALAPDIVVSDIIHTLPDHKMRGVVVVGKIDGTWKVMAARAFPIVDIGH